MNASFLENFAQTVRNAFCCAEAGIVPVCRSVDDSYCDGAISLRAISRPRTDDDGFEWWVPCSRCLVP